jgi:alcohol dehydrogenase class IV
MPYSLKLRTGRFWARARWRRPGPTSERCGKKALIVTGKVVKKGEAFARLTALLSKLGAGWAVFSDIPGEPDDR